MKRYFIQALKTNCLIALGRKDKLQGSFQRIYSLDWSETPICGCVNQWMYKLFFSDKSLKTKMAVRKFIFDQ